MSDGNMILVVGALMVAALVATLAAGRLKVPGLVLFLGLGMAVGSDGAGWIQFSNFGLARTIGVIALALILFEGGLTAGLSEIRPEIRSSLSLALLGTLLTAAVTGVAATWLFDLPLLQGLLIGSIVSATDGAAIFGLLRDSTLRQRIARTLEGEAGFNDPVAVLLVVGFIEWIQQPDYGVSDMLVLFAKEMGIGLVVGLAVGWLGTKVLRSARLGAEAAYPVGTMGIAAVAYGAAASLHGSGFLAVYLAGLLLGSVTIPAKRQVTVFHEGLAWIAQVTMFFVLGLLVFPSQLDDIAVDGTVLALVLMFVARPIAVWASTALSDFTGRERTILTWAGLRGAVPVVLATFPIIDHVSDSHDFFNIVFFAVLLSTLLQGATFEPLARRLGMTGRDPPAPRPRATMPSAGVSTTKPWRPEDGDPAYPKTVTGVPINKQLLTRIDKPGALVRLEDGRHAFTGPIVSVGSARAVRNAARRRLAQAGSDAERSWWRQVIGTLAQ